MKDWIGISFGPYLQTRIQEAVRSFVGEKVDGTEERAQQFAEDCAWLLFEVEQELAKARDEILFERATDELFSLED